MSAEFDSGASFRVTAVPEVNAAQFSHNYALEHCFNSNGAPLCVRGYASAWPATRKWTFDYLAAQDVSGTKVALSMGVEELAEATVKRSCTFKQYCMELKASEAESALSAQCAPAKSETTPQPLNLPNDGHDCRHPGYLKQCELLSLFPTLAQDIGPLPFSPGMAFITPYAWVGAQGAHTGLHQDDEANALVVLRGRKRVRLVHPDAAPLLSVNDKYDSGTNCCDASLLRPDFESFPALAQLRHTVYDVELQAGDALLFDVNWWHEAISPSHSVSLNFFASSWWDMLVRGVPRGIGILAHEAGLYRAGSCVCHSDAALKAAGEATTDAPSQATVPLTVLGGALVCIAGALVWHRHRGPAGLLEGVAGLLWPKPSAPS